MSDSTESGAGAVQERGKGYATEILVKVAASVIVLVLVGVSGVVWAHESRTAALEGGARAHGEKHDAEAEAREKQYAWTKESLDEIKAKLNKLLEAR